MISPVTQAPVPTTDVSATMTGSWVLIAAENFSREVLLMMNVGSNNIGIYIADPRDAAAPSELLGIGSEGVDTMVPGGTYSPPPVPTGAIWAKGTLADVLTARVG